MKNNIEVFNKISNLNFLDMINSIEEINISNLVNLSLEVNELSSSLDFDSINKQLFKYNNLLNKSKKEHDLDVKSFNLGVISTFLKTMTFIERSNKTINFEITKKENIKIENFKSENMTDIKLRKILSDEIKRNII